MGKRTCRAAAAVTLVMSVLSFGVPASGGATAPVAASRSSDAHEVAASRLLVRWADGTGARGRLRALEAVGARVVHDLGEVVAVQLADPGGVDRALRRLRHDPRVADVERDQVVRTATTDPGYPQQWGIENTGQTVQDRKGRSGIDARVTPVWPRSKGDPAIVVAIVDSGVDIEHPDLAANIWRNQSEEANGFDDDGNGLIDDVTGWDFKHEDASVFDDPDGDSHGTELAGVIAALADNEIGIAGVAPGLRLMPVKFLDHGFGAISDALAALRYAADHGADVILTSWIGASDHEYLEEVIRDTGVLVVAPAGNGGQVLDDNAPAYPASYTLPNLVSVAAIDNAANLPDFSNTGSRFVDLAAPGADILTTDPDEGYAFVSGTSMAAAFTAGAAGLALSVNPHLPAAELADLIRRSTRPYVTVADATISGGLLDTDRLVTFAEQAAEPGACFDPPPQSDFEDVSRSSVHVTSIDCLVFRGGAAGRDEQHYDPRGPVSRAAMATFLYRVITTAGIEVPDPPDAFTDDDGSVHEGSIDAVADLGIVEGRGEGVYAPHEIVTRAQMATMLRRTYAVIAGTNVWGSRQWFDDIGPPHGASINAVRDLGVVMGSMPRKFTPSATVNRAQMASFLVALLDVLAREGHVTPQ